MWSSELVKLVPAYAASQIVYWLLLFYPNNQDFSIVAMLVKCLPISVLALYVHFHAKPKNKDNAAVCLF
jgi:hypothetical protein